MTETTESDNLTALRSAVASFNEDEKLAFAGILGLDCASSFEWSIFRPEGRSLGVLERMTQVSGQFSKAEKLAFAIELLEHCQDAEEAKNGIDNEVEHFRDGRLDQQPNMIKILSDDINTIAIISPEKDAVLKLREIIPILDMSEAIALATMLSHSYSLKLSRWVGISAIRDFSQNLTTAILQVPALSAATKLAITIEILQLCQEGEPAGHESSNDDDDGKYDGDVDIDSLPNPRFHRS